MAEQKKNLKKRNSIDNSKDDYINDVKKEISSKVKAQLTKEVIDEIKKDLISISKEEVRNDLRKEIDKEIKRNTRRVLNGRRGKIFRRDIVIIILLVIIGYLVWFMYNHNYISFNINSNFNNVSISNDKKVAKSVDDYSYLLDMVNVKLPVNNINSLSLYNGEHNIKTIDASIKLTMAYNLIDSNEFTSEQLKNAYIMLFGSDKYYKDTSFDYECKHFKYQDGVYNMTNDECSNTSSKDILEIIIKTKKKSNKVIITTVMGIYDKDEHSLYNYKNLYEPVAVGLNSNFNILDYQNKLNTYKYTFIKNGDKYMFDNISN